MYLMIGTKKLHNIITYAVSMLEGHKIILQIFIYKHTDNIHHMHAKICYTGIKMHEFVNQHGQVCNIQSIS